MNRINKIHSLFYLQSASEVNFQKLKMPRNKTIGKSQEKDKNQK